MIERQILTVVAICHQSTFIRYGMNGCFVAMFALGFLSFLIECLAVPPPVASFVMITVAITTNYYLQRTLVFNSNADHFQAAPKFILLCLSTLTINAAAFPLLSFYLPYTISQVIVFAIVFPINYYINKTLVFHT